MIREVFEIKTQEKIAEMTEEIEKIKQIKLRSPQTVSYADISYFEKRFGFNFNIDNAILELESQKEKFDKSSKNPIKKLFSPTLRKNEKENNNNLSKLYQMKVESLEQKIAKSNEELENNNKAHSQIQKLIEEFQKENPSIPTANILDHLKENDPEKEAELRKLLDVFNPESFNDCITILEKKQIEPVLDIVDLSKMSYPNVRGLNDLDDLIAIHKTDFMPDKDMIQSNKSKKAMNERLLNNRWEKIFILFHGK